jgi:hypothetical protein
VAERRMFAKTIIDSDAFLDMPISARLLYYDLAMRADDDGFINSPKKIMKFIGATNDDMNILIMRKFIIPFDNGVVVIKHWRIHNYIRKDTYNETAYKEEKSMLELDENKAYRIASQLSVDEPSTQVRLGKDSIGYINNNVGKNFTPPTVEEVQAYCQERNNKVDAQAFVDFYSSKGWMVGKNKMKDWKAAVRTWERNRKDDGGGGSFGGRSRQGFPKQNYDFDALEKELGL